MQNEKKRKLESQDSQAEKHGVESGDQEVPSPIGYCYPEQCQNVKKITENLGFNKPQATKMESPEVAHRGCRGPQSVWDNPNISTLTHATTSRPQPWACHPTGEEQTIGPVSSRQEILGDIARVQEKLKSAVASAETPLELSPRQCEFITNSSSEMLSFGSTDESEETQSDLSDEPIFSPDAYQAYCAMRDGDWEQSGEREVTVVSHDGNSSLRVRLSNRDPESYRPYWE